MIGFVVDGERVVAEVTNKEGKIWKIGSAKTPLTTSYFVIETDGPLDLIVTSFEDSLGRPHAIAFADKSAKEKALAIFDHRFLAGVADASDPFKQWVEEHKDVLSGKTKLERVMDTEKGGLGTGDIRIDNDKIIGRIKAAKCHCYEMPMSCAGLPSTFIACINDICDVINCTIDILNGSGSNCGQEGATAQTSCELAVGEPQ